MNSPSLNHGFPLFFFFFFLHGLRLILVLVAFVAEIAQGGMASHEEMPSLSLRNGFRCVPEDGVTVEKCAHSTGGEVGHENIVSASRITVFLNC